MSDNLYVGFEILQNQLSEIIKNVEKPTKILEVGAKEFVKDLSKLPRPISEIRKSAYTHLIDTFAFQTQKKEVAVGWGKYYGFMVENGTIKMNARAHLNPLWERNKNKYYNLMTQKALNY